MKRIEREKIISIRHFFWYKICEARLPVIRKIIVDICNEDMLSLFRPIWRTEKIVWARTMLVNLSLSFSLSHSFFSV